MTQVNLINKKIVRSSVVLSSKTMLVTYQDYTSEEMSIEKYRQVVRKVNPPSDETKN